MVSRTLASVLAALGLLGGCAGGGEEPGGAAARLERVVDSDTLVLADGQRVRLIQIDASEGQEGECYADEAAEALEELVPAGSEVMLEADPALDDLDRFGRLLRYVIRDDRNANLELVRRGAAAPWFFEGDRAATPRSSSMRPKWRAGKLEACGAPAQVRRSTPSEVWTAVKKKREAVATRTASLREVRGLRPPTDFASGSLDPLRSP